jgi:hypothetical protein
MVDTFNMKSFRASAALACLAQARNNLEHELGLDLNPFKRHEKKRAARANKRSGCETPRLT